MTRDRCAVVGVGNTDYSFNSGRSTLTLAAQASVAALTDAGLEPGDIDGIVRCEMDEVLHADLAATLGMSNVGFWAAGSWAGAAPCGMVGLAVNAICSGQATNVLVFRSLNGRSGRRFGREWSALRLRPAHEFLGSPREALAAVLLFEAMGQRNRR